AGPTAASMEGHRYTKEVQVRYRDLDPMDHVNNAVHASYVETARIGYYDEVLGLDFDDLSFMLAHLEFDYHRPIYADDTVVVGVSTTAVGDKSMTTEYTVEASGDVASTGESVQVAVDPDGRPTNVPGEWREAIEEYEDVEL
ncbi:MAG: acyl-CoA thioesterase, partial [Halobacteriales archaeon]